MLHAIRRRAALSFLTAVLATATAIAAAKPPEPSADEAAIRAAAVAFTKAFDRQDAKTIAALWTAQGTLADERGEIFKGRKAIEDQYTAFFQRYPGARMEVTVQSVEFPTPTTAIEDGLAQVVVAGPEPPAASRYTAVHVRDGGKWLMASVRESSIPIPSNFSRLTELAWLIGDWHAHNDDATVETSFRWIANKSFIQRNYSVRRQGLVVSAGTQIIGWDPHTGQIASWSFDSSGGHGSGRWSPAPEGWRIDSTGVLADGTPTSSRDLLIRVAGEDNVFGWRSFARKAGQTTLNDTREIVLDRVNNKR